MKLEEMGFYTLEDVRAKLYEDLYLEYAWIFGIHTYKYINKQIKYFSLIK